MRRSGRKKQDSAGWSRLDFAWVGCGFADWNLLDGFWGRKFERNVQLGFGVDVSGSSHVVIFVKASMFRWEIVRFWLEAIACF